MRYPFYCHDCGTVFDIAISWHDFIITNVRCPNCFSRNITRKWNDVPVIYKDNGYTKKVSEIKK
jgi:RNA polymerase subunit RPABC4/transcription elongation factor Spt4